MRTFPQAVPVLVAASRPPPRVYDSTGLVLPKPSYNGWIADTKNDPATGNPTDLNPATTITDARVAAMMDLASGGARVFGIDNENLTSLNGTWTHSDRDHALVNLHVAMLDRCRAYTKGRVRLGFYGSGYPVQGRVLDASLDRQEQWERETPQWRPVMERVDFVGVDFYITAGNPYPDWFSDRMSLANRLRAAYGVEVVCFFHPNFIGTQARLPKGSLRQIVLRALEAGHSAWAWGEGRNAGSDVYVGGDMAWADEFKSATAGLSPG